MADCGIESPYSHSGEQVDKGVMPELDMTNNYVGLYKAHEDTFQIMLTLKPKKSAPKKK